MRTAAAFVCSALVAATVVMTHIPAASACTCPVPVPAAEAAETAEWVFTARQVGMQFEETEDGRKARLQMEVLQVYKGDVPTSLELRTNAGGADCGVDFSDRGVVGFTLTPLTDGSVYVSSCGGWYLPDEVRWLYQPLPAGSEYGAPGFVVGTDVSPARIALLDEQVRLIGYGIGEGRLVDAAVCPGGAKIVEVVGPEGNWVTGDAAQPFLEIRDVPTLNIERHFDVNLRHEDLNGLEGDWVIDMQCHDPDATFVTYILPKERWDSPVMLHLWRDGQLDVVDVGDARAIAVDPDRELAYTIVGADGMDLEIRDLNGDLIETMPVPLGHQALKLAFSPDRSELVLLTTDNPMRSEHWFYAEVNSMLVMDVETRDSAAIALPKTGNAYLFAPRTDGFTTATFHLDSLSMMVTNLLEGEIEIVGEYPAINYQDPVAVGANTVLLADTDASDAQAVLALDLATGQHLPIADLIRSGLAISFPGPVPHAQPLPVVTTVPETSEVPTNTYAAQTTTPLSSTPVAWEELAGDDNAVWLIVVTAVAIAGLLGVGGLLVSRRHRRSPSPE